MNAIDQKNTFEVRDEQGFAAYVLSNEAVELVVIPELGARIISLKNQRSGREWMWHPAGGLKLFRNRVGDDFARSPLVGMDECLPTIAPCSWRGRTLPDHGEVWAARWKVDEQAWKIGMLKTSVNLPVSPLEFERTIELEGGEIHFSYQLRNLGSKVEQYLWAMHPLLQINDGDQLTLPASTRARMKREAWIEGAVSAMPDGGCAKVFAQHVRVGCAGVYNRNTMDYLEFHWDRTENDSLGLWLTQGGWHGHHHLALEPTNGDRDALTLAAEGNRCGAVSPFGLATWNVRLSVGV